MGKPMPMQQSDWQKQAPHEWQWVGPGPFGNEIQAPREWQWVGPGPFGNEILVAGRHAVGHRMNGSG
jgi:hypothetical protein